MFELPYPYQKKEIVLVLPHTFFIDNFRQYGEEDTVTHLENLAKMMLISEIIARKRAFNPNAYFGATSKRVFDLFEEKLDNVSPFSSLNLKAFKEALFIDEDEKLNKLKYPEQTVIAVADKLKKTHYVNPIIVVRGDSVKRWESDYIKTFYKRDKESKHILAVCSVSDALDLIKSKQKEFYYSAKKSISDQQLMYYLPK